MTARKEGALNPLSFTNRFVGVPTKAWSTADAGIDKDELAFVKAAKNEPRGRLTEYASAFGPGAPRA